MGKRPKYMIPTPEELDAWTIGALQPYRHSPEAIERIKAAKRELKERRKTLADLVNGRPMATRPQGVTDAVLRVFDGGGWVSSVECRERSGVGSGNAKGTIARLVEWGCLEKRERAGYDKTVPQHRHPGGECRYEFRQTPDAWSIRETKRNSFRGRKRGGKHAVMERGWKKRSGQAQPEGQGDQPGQADGRAGDEV